MNRYTDTIEDALVNLGEKLEVAVPAEGTIADKINYIAENYEVPSPDPVDEGNKGATLVITVDSEDDTISNPTFDLVCDDPEAFMKDYFDLTTKRVEPTVVLNILTDQGIMTQTCQVEKGIASGDLSTMTIIAKLVPFDTNYYKYVSWERANNQDTFTIFYQ